MGAAAYSSYDIPEWPWQEMPAKEYGYASAPAVWNPVTNSLTLKLDAFEARVFTV
jgi:hypothetical protein